MPLAVKINLALREQNCQKIGSERVNGVELMKFKINLRCLHHFKSDLINNMDHVRISGTKPTSVILSQIK